MGGLNTGTFFELPDYRCLLDQIDDPPPTLFSDFP
jgi:hypothetical protein